MNSCWFTGTPGDPTGTTTTCSGILLRTAIKLEIIRRRGQGASSGSPSLEKQFHLLKESSGSSLLQDLEKHQTPELLPRRPSSGPAASPEQITATQQTSGKTVFPGTGQLLIN